MNGRGWRVASAALAGVALASPAFAQLPPLRLGHAVTVAPKVRLFGDVGRLSVVPGADGTSLDLPRRRVGAEARIGSRLDVEVEHEFASGNRWRDVFADVRLARVVHVRAGKFKVPFSLDQLTGAGSRDLVYRARIGSLLAPGRSTGIALRGRFARRRLTYEAGWFSRDGDVARFSSNPGAGPTAAGRLSVRPLRFVGVTGDAGDLELAVNATVGRVPEGLHSLRGRLAASDEFFAPVFVNGQRTRRGVDVSWSPGRLSVQAEAVRVDDERIGQGIRGETLPRLSSEGWYVAGAWRVAGRRPSRVTDSGGGHRFGRLDAAARFEGMAVRTSASSVPALRNPRAVHLLTQSMRGWTVGATWHATPWLRMQANVMRETLSDALRSPVTGRQAFWTHVVRVQWLLQ